MSHRKQARSWPTGPKPRTIHRLCDSPSSIGRIESEAGNPSLDSALHDAQVGFWPKMHSRFLVPGLVVALAACGSHGDKTLGHASLPLLTYEGGPLLTAPAIVTVTFPGDPMAAQLETFGETVASSGWWDGIRAGLCASGGQMCVGDGPPGAGVELSTAASMQYTDATLQAWLASAITGGVLPKPDANATSNTVYVLYFPSTTTITFDGVDSCVGFTGYHNAMPFGSQQLPYAVAMECGAMPSLVPNVAPLTALQNTTMSASHEIVEAVTDPIAFTGWVIDETNPNNRGWIDMTGGGEAADMCFDVLGLDQDETSDGAFSVQRIWSNAQAAAGEDPCHPLLPDADVYFNAAPKQAFFVVGVGESVTFEVDAFSSAPMGDWTLTAQDWSDPTTAYLSFTLAGGIETEAGPEIQVSDGSQVQVTMTLLRDPGSLGFGEADGMLISTSGSVADPQAGHFWPIAVMSPADAADAGINPGTNSKKHRSRTRLARPVHSPHVEPAR